MAVHYRCDRCNALMVPAEVSRFRLSGPVAEALLRREAHICKTCVHEAAAGLGFTIAPLTSAVAEEMDRRRAIEHGREAGSQPPKPAA